MVLFTETEAKEAIDSLRGTPEYTKKWWNREVGASSNTPLTSEGTAMANSRKEIFTRVGPAPPSFEELGIWPHPGLPSISAKKMARLLAYLRSYSLDVVLTQGLGNCLYSSVLRGTDVRMEFVSMHLRRLICIVVSKYPDFFAKYLRHQVATDYGCDRLPESEISKREKAGKIKPEEARDMRGPGPFSLVTFLEFILQDGTWGDLNILTIISLMWQISITILNAEEFGEIRIRHNLALNQVDLVVIFMGGDHYMGCGMY